MLYRLDELMLLPLGRPRTLIVVGISESARPQALTLARTRERGLVWDDGKARQGYSL
jgi:hypothetical protein